MRRFFVFSELLWLAIFCLCLILGGLSMTSTLYAHALFILVFTACEAVILASILLLSFEGTLETNTSSIKY